MTESELLDRAVTVVGLLYGALEELRDELKAEGRSGQVRGIERVLQKADELRNEF